MRLKTISFSALLFPVLAFAGPIGQGEAARVASEFMNNRRHGTAVTEVRCTYAHSRQNSKKAADGREAAYYVFGNDTGGFVIVAGDDRLPSVIGYSDTGRFDAERMPEACRAWLEAVARTVENADGAAVQGNTQRYLQGDAAEKTAGYAAAVEYPSKAVSPLVTSTWDQGAPYNALTPAVNGMPTLTGCVATATAQIMYYHRWPERPTGNVSYTDNGNLRTMDFDAQSAFDWNGMFHFNWGWSGVCDGYFSLSALSPQTQGAGGVATSYSFNQAIECRIQPAGKGESVVQEAHLLWIYDLYVYVGDKATTYRVLNHDDIKAASDSDSGFFFYCMSGGHSDFNGEVCAAIVTDDGMQPIASTVRQLQVRAGGYEPLYLTISDGSLGSGTFRVGFFYRTSADGEWHPIDANLYGPRESRVTVGDGTVTYGRVQPYVSMREESLDGVSAKMYSGYDYMLSLKGQNDGSIFMNGWMGVMIAPAGNGGVTSSGNAIISAERVFVAEGETADMQCTLSTRGMAAGEYTITSVYTTAAEATESTVTPMGVRRSISLMPNPGLGVVAPAGGYYIVERPAPGFGITLMKTVADRWQGRIVARISQGGEDTGVALSADGLDMSGISSGYSCSVTGDMSQLSSNVLYDVTFCIDAADGPVIGTGRLVLTGTETSIGSVSAEQAMPSVSVGGGMLSVSSPERISRIVITDMQGRVLRDARAVGHEYVMPTGSLPEGIYIIGVITESGKSSVSVKI